MGGQLAASGAGVDVTGPDRQGQGDGGSEVRGQWQQAWARRWWRRGSREQSRLLEVAAGAGGWCAGKLRARDASGRAVREARSSGTDELRDMMAAKRAKVAGLAAMRERVGAEMAAAMDTGATQVCA